MGLGQRSLSLNANAPFFFVTDVNEMLKDELWTKPAQQRLRLLSLIEAARPGRTRWSPTPPIASSALRVNYSEL